MHSLVLNATYEPLAFVGVERAVTLYVLGKAEILEKDETRPFRSEKLSVPYPKVIRLLMYVEVPRSLRKSVSRRMVFLRDEFTCQYCGRHKKELKKGEHLTLDHVKPKSRGGLTTWDNVTTACTRCNDKKADKLPYECKMYPLKTPKEPRYLALVLLEKADEDQKKYLEWFFK